MLGVRAMHISGLLGGLLGGTLAFAHSFGAAMLATVYNLTAIIVAKGPTIVLAMMARALPAVTVAL